MDFVNLNKTSGSMSYWEFKGLTDYVDKWTLMSTPYPVLVTFVLYIVVVTKLGPQYMRNRPPFKLDNVIIAYNVFQVFLSAFLLSQVGSFVYRNGILQNKCVTSENAEEKYFFLSVGYYFLLAKFSELLDTIFFVLRKKQNQVSFLHVYHHSVMLVAVWVGIKYDQNENYAFPGLLNSGVHVIMYAYYGLSAFPALKKHLWWKKYITTMQLVQFLMVLVHLIAVQFISECPPPTSMYYFALFNMVFFYYLFNNFYKESYTKIKKNKCEKTVNNHFSVKSSNCKNENVKKNPCYELYYKEKTEKKR